MGALVQTIPGEAVLFPDTSALPGHGNANGYFSAWAGAACGVCGLGVSMAHVRSVSYATRLRLGCALLAIFLICVSSPLVSLAGQLSMSDGPWGNVSLTDHWPYSQSQWGNLVYGLVVGCVTIPGLLSLAWVEVHAPALTVGGRVDVSSVEGARRVMGASLLALWLTAAFGSTFYGVFGTVGNGYLTLWGGAIAHGLLMNDIIWPDAASGRGGPREPIEMTPSDTGYSAVLRLLGSCKQDTLLHICQDLSLPVSGADQELAVRIVGELRDGAAASRVGSSRGVGSAMPSRLGTM